MLKYFTHILLIAVAVVWAQALYTRVFEKNLVQDAAVDFVVHSWKERTDVPEPHKSKAIEQIEAMKNQKWKGLGNFFLQLLDVSEAREKAAPKPAIIKAQTENYSSDESMEDMMKQLFIEILLIGATSSEEPVLEKRFKNATKMKFKSIDDFGQYCIKVFEEVTGRTSPNGR